MSDRDEVTFFNPDQAEALRHQLLAEGLREIAAQSHRYVSEPSDGAWYELVRALSNVLGDAEAYELLRATELHADTRKR